jgi:TPR repeat protein
MNFICRAFYLLTLLFASHTTLAAEETYLREYTYQASEADSKITARAIALQEVKRILLSELGTHVSSLVKLQADASGKRLGTEQIETLSAGVTRVEILAEKWDGVTYVLKAQIKADPANVLRSLEKMLGADAKQKQVSQLGGELNKVRGENMQMSEQLTESRKAADNAMVEIARLKQQLKRKQTDAQRAALQKQYQAQTQQLTAQELFDTGWKKHEEGNDAEAANFWRKAAEQGGSDAQNNLGMMYSKGEGVLQDFQQALYWFHKAAEQGKAGKYNIGVMYDKGAGVPQDFKQAVYWYRQAAEQNHISAQSNLGVMYAKGEGVPQDFMQAIYWYSKAAEQGNASAQYNLGMMYGKGQGVPQSYQIELTWIRKAAAQGHEKAIKFLPILQRLNP